MEIKSKFDHFNINVTNLERSIAFYEKALGLKEHHRKESSDGSFTLVYLTDGPPGTGGRRPPAVRPGPCPGRVPMP